MSIEENSEVINKRLLTLLITSVVLGACLLTLAGGLFLFSPTSLSERSRIAELLNTSTSIVTATANDTATYTPLPTTSETPIITPTLPPSATLQPTATDAPTATATPLPLSDGRET